MSNRSAVDLDHAVNEGLGETDSSQIYRYGQEIGSKWYGGMDIAVELLTDKLKKILIDAMIRGLEQDHTPRPSM